MSRDVTAFLILTSLYIIQGIPVGLIWGSMPSILSDIPSYSYSQQAIFTFASYPYSMKLLWSPLVDSLSFPGIGRRKSWIFSSQIAMSMFLVYIGYHIDSWINTMDIYSITIWCFFLILATATQDIGVDGWALTLLSRENVSYQSLAQSFGINVGFAIAFPLLLTLNIPLSSFMYITGMIIFCVNLCVCYWVNEEPDDFSNNCSNHKKRSDGISIFETYHAILKILKIPQVKELSVILLTRHVTFTAYVAVTSMKLQKKGLSKELTSWLTLILVPLELFHPVIIRYISTLNLSVIKQRLGRLTIWKYAYCLRIIICLMGVLNVYCFDGNVTNRYLVTLVVIKSMHSFLCSVQWINRAAFFAEIADPAIGATYMTLLTTITNLGKTWPKYFVLKSVDWLTMSVPNENGMDIITVDGYYILIGIGTLYGLIWIYFTSSPLRKLDDLSRKGVWKVSKSIKGRLSD